VNTSTTATTMGTYTMVLALNWSGSCGPTLPLPHPRSPLARG
jgi:hypothetical protein